MKKLTVSFLIVICGLVTLCAQSGKRDSLRVELGKVKTDTARMQLLYDLYVEYLLNNEFENAFQLLEEGVQIAEKGGHADWQLSFLREIAVNYLFTIGNLPKAVETGLKRLKLAESLNDSAYIHSSYILLGSLYSETDSETALSYFSRAKKMMPKDNRQATLLRFYTNLEKLFLERKQLDSA